MATQIRFDNQNIYDSNRVAAADGSVKRARACQNCKTKKLKCDKDSHPGQVCSNCKNKGINCQS